MTSVVRSIAQRNTNVNEIVPVFGGTSDISGGPFGDLSGAAYYTLNLPTVQYTGGSFFVDLSGVNLSGRYYTDVSGLQLPIVNFIVNVAMPASSMPNLEFTIHFKNTPAFFPLTVGILASASATFPFLTPCAAYCRWTVCESEYYLQKRWHSLRSCCFRTCGLARSLLDCLFGEFCILTIIQNKPLSFNRRKWTLLSNHFVR